MAEREQQATAAVAKLCFLEYCLREVYEADRHCAFVERVACARSCLHSLRPNT